ncbi:peptidase [compost metagenome]
MVTSYRSLFQQEPVIDKWTFSTNGVAIMGLHGIPCIGFGPGEESEAHAPNEKTWKSHLIDCAAMYAAIPTIYVQTNSK